MKWVRRWRTSDRWGITPRHRVTPPIVGRLTVCDRRPTANDTLASPSDAARSPMGLQKAFLIDGTAFCYRAFYAIRNLSTADGRPTNAVY